MHPQVSIIILNYNTPELTTACVQSIVAHTHDISYEIILIDNGSREDSRKYFETYLSDTPHLIVYHQSHNHGFGGGNNIGAGYSHGEYLFFLNSDTIVYENSIKILYDEYKRLEENHKMGFMAPRLYYDHEKTIKQIFCTKAPTLGDVAIYNIPFLKKIRKKKYEKFSYAEWDRESDKEVGNCGGPVFYCSRKCFLDIGKFDTQFFLYMEEFDTSMRLAQRGYHNFYTVKTSIIHLENQSPKIKRKKLKISLESMIKFFRKYR